MMGHVLNLVYGGTTVNLYNTGSSYTNLMGYGMRGGGESLTVEEAVSVQFHHAGDDASNTAIRAALAGIVAAAREASEWQKSRGRSGTQVFLKIQPGGSGDTYRSEVVLIDHSIDPQWIYGQWSAHVLDVTFRLVRRNFWELDSLTTLVNGTQVYNHDDGGASHDNYVQVDAVSAAGQLPAPIFLQIENHHNDADEITHVWVGHGTWLDAASFDHILEGEDADYNVGGALATGCATCSNGNYLGATWAADAETLLYRWDDLTKAYLDEALAKRVRILVRFHSAPGAVTFRAAITFPSGATTVELQSTGTVLADATELVYDLGELDLPPWLERETGNWQAVSLALYGQITGGTTVNLDFVHPQPIDGGGRYYRPAIYGVEYGEWMIDDPDTGHCYRKYSSGYKAGSYVPAGEPLYVWPGRVNRYYFLWRDVGGAAIAKTALITIKYRPRRQTL